MAMLSRHHSLTTPHHHHHPRHVSFLGVQTTGKKPSLCSPGRLAPVSRPENGNSLVNNMSKWHVVRWQGAERKADGPPPSETLECGLASALSDIEKWKTNAGAKKHWGEKQAVAYKVSQVDLLRLHWLFPRECFKKRMAGLFQSEWSSTEASSGQWKDKPRVRNSYAEEYGMCCRQRWINCCFVLIGSHWTGACRK